MFNNKLRKLKVNQGIQKQIKDSESKLIIN